MAFLFSNDHRYKLFLLTKWYADLCQRSALVFACFAKTHQDKKQNNKEQQQNNNISSTAAH